MICKNCNLETGVDVEVCPFCGTPLAEEAADTAAEVTQEAAEISEENTVNAEVLEDKPEEPDVAQVETVETENEPAEDVKKEPEKDDAFAAAYMPGSVIQPEKKKSKAGLIIGLIAGGFVLLAAVLAGLYFFVFNGSLPFGGGRISKLTETNISAATPTYMMKSGNDYYFNLPLDAKDAKAGLYKGSADGRRKELIVEGNYMSYVVIGQYIVANTAVAGAESYTYPLGVINMKTKEVNDVGSQMAANLRVSGDWCYYAELSADGQSASGIRRYNPATNVDEAVYEGSMVNFSVKGDTLILLTANNEAQKYAIETYDMVQKGETKKLGEYDLIPLGLQLDENFIYVLKQGKVSESTPPVSSGTEEGDASAVATPTTGLIARVPYTGGELEDLYEFSLAINNAQFIVDDEGIFWSDLAYDQTTGAPTGKTVLLDKNGKNPVELETEGAAMYPTKIGNIFYYVISSGIAQDQNQDFTFNSMNVKSKKVSVVFDTAGAAEDTDNSSSSAVSLESVPDTLMNEDYDPEVQLAKPKKGDEIGVITTNMGVIKVRFFEEQAPRTVANFKELAKKGDFNGSTFHRVIKDFMIQGGKTKEGKSIYGDNFEDEFNKNLVNITGALSMANAGANTNSTEFFINHRAPDSMPNWEEWISSLDMQETSAGQRSFYQPKRIPELLRKQYTTLGGAPDLDGAYRTDGGGHTVFGQVIEGMDIVEKIAAVEVDDTGETPKTAVTIEKIEIVKYS